MNRGIFITFEGGEGAGKSTQAQILVNKLRAEGFDVIATREPGGTRIGEQIRAITHNTENIDLDPVAEAYLMAASRAQHVREMIEPALKNGKIVISDRFVDSSIAYQGFGRNIGEDNITQLNKLAVNGAIPDIIIFLNIEPEAGHMRIVKEGKLKDRLDMQEQIFYKNVHEGYLSLAKKYSNRYVVIMATGSIDDVAGRVWQEVQKKLPKVDSQ